MRFILRSVNKSRDNDEGAVQRSIQVDTAIICLYRVVGSLE